MGKFKEAIGELLQVNLAQGALFMFGVGLAATHQREFGPPGACAAQFPLYQRIGFLDFAIPLTILASTKLAADVRYRVPEQADGEHAVVDARQLRALLLLAVLLSVASAGSGLAVTTEVLQVKVSVFACWTIFPRLVVYAMLAFFASVYAAFYFRVGWVAMFTDIS